MKRTINKTAPVKKNRGHLLNKSPTPHARSHVLGGLQSPEPSTAWPTRAHRSHSQSLANCGNLKYSIIESRGIPSFSSNEYILQQENSSSSRAKCGMWSSFNTLSNRSSLYKYQTRRTNRRRRRRHQICTGKPISYVSYGSSLSCRGGARPARVPDSRTIRTVANSNSSEDL